MNLSEITSQTAPDHSNPARRQRREIPSWLLPAALIIGFLFVFLLLFGGRFLPALPVRVAPVITVRSDLASNFPPQQTQEAESTSSPSTAVAPRGQMLFQASGWVEPDPFPIGVPVLVDGIIDTVLVLEGESVTKGQILATMVNDDAKLNYQEASQNVASLQAQIDAHCHKIPAMEAKISGLEKSVAAEKSRLLELQDRLKRLNSLSGGSISEQQVAAARLQVQAQSAVVEQAEASVPEAEAELEIIGLERVAMESRLSEMKTKQARMKLALDRHTIRSPMDGIVLHLHAAPGKKRMIGMDDPKSAMIVELFEPGKLQARIDVPLTEASLISVGQPVEMTTDLLPNVTLNGHVTRITGQADIQRNTLQVKVAIADPDERLRPEMLVRGKFYAPPAKPDSENGDSIPSPGISGGGRLTLFVPEGAITDDESIWVVSGENTCEKRPVKSGNERREDHVQILEGVRSGEQVILPPHTELEPGKRIRIES